MKIVKLHITCLLLFTTGYLFAQQIYCPPANIGFEEGNFKNWSCDTGGVDRGGGIELVPTVNPIYGRQTLINASNTMVDKFGKFPVLCPYGGKYSVQLGNEEVNAHAERLSYTFTVPAGADAYTLVFYYAVVLQNPSHLPYQQPRFTVQTFNVTDHDYIECASFDFIASSYLPGFKLAPVISRADTSVYYKDWAPAMINLQNVAGKTMRIDFTTNDCTLGGHFGYAYIDVDEGCTSPVTGNNYCTGQRSVTLVAPGGFGGYTWYNADMTTPISLTRSITISPPPPDNTVYAVRLDPYYGLGCTSVLHTTVHSINSGFVFAVKDTIHGCDSTGADLTDPAITAGSDADLTLSYFTDLQGTQYLYRPQKILTSGTYYIKAVSPEGCTNVLPVVVVINSPQIKITNPAPVVFPGTVDITATFAHEPGVTYTYYADTTAAPVTDYMAVPASGVYYVRGTNAYGCTTIVPVRVIINAPPPPIIQAANTFTPNGDNINDYFGVKVIGFGAFESLRIYNRYGELVFQTKSAYTPWDGKLNGKPLSSGTYYWLFNGKNTYYNTSVVQSGYVDLIR